MNISSTSSNSSSGSTDYSRITGLASGLDVDGLVKTSLQPDQTKIDQANQTLQYTQWQQAAYVDFISSLKDFGNNFDILKSGNLMSASNYTGTTATSTLASGLDASTYMTSTTLPGAVQGNYQVQINSLAEGGKSQLGTSSVAFGSSPTSLSGKYITIGATTINLGNYTAATTSQQVVDDINSQLTANGIANFTASSNNGTIILNTTSTSSVNISSNAITSPGGTLLNRSVSAGFNSSSKLSDLGLGGSDTLKISVGSGSVFQVAINPGDTISDFVNRLKTTTNNGDALSNYVNINYSDLTGKLSIESKSTGSATSLKIDSTTGNADSLGIVNTFSGKDASVSIKAPGENTFTTVTKSSNNFTIDNVTYNLVSATGGQTINLTVKADASAAVDKFTKFVDAYNKLIDKINTTINEKKDYDYKPLTDTQRSQMTTDQINNWETKAKQGILRNDNYLSNIVTSMRQALYDTVKGAGISITQIGITTSSDYTDGGKLVIDTKKLTNAFQQNGDLVQKLFTQTEGTNQSSGIFQKFKTIIDKATGSDGSLVKKAGYTNTRWVVSNDLTKSISKQSAKISDMKQMMAQKQQTLYSMYATLETNLGNLNSQSNWLSSQLGSM